MKIIKFKQLYVKYLIKNPALFYGFIGLFLAVFFSLSLTIKIDVVNSYPATIDGNIITVDGINNETVLTNKIYYYINRNEKIYKSAVDEYSTNNNKLIIHILGNEENQISGAIKIDIVVGSQSLLKRIIVKTRRI